MALGLSDCCLIFRQNVVDRADNRSGILKLNKVTGIRNRS
jgi:hypothetical protein